MLRRPFLAMFCILCLGPAWAASGDLVGWWTFDETAGTAAADSSGQGNNGTIVGNPQWVAGKIGGALQFDGNTYVNCGRSPSLNIRDQITIAFWFKVQAFTNTWEAFLAKGDGAYRSSRGDGGGNGTHLGISGANYFNAPTIITDNQWHHYCGTYNGTTAIIYIDGKEDARQTYSGQIGDSSNFDLYIGENSQATGRRLHGLMDDVQIYNNALTPAEILGIMEGLADASLAGAPSPDDAATDVHQDAVLSWQAGEYAAAHDVYFGKTMADVNNASRTNPNGLLVSQGQAATEFDPEGLLEFGQTYYWRIDEVNGAPDNTIFKGGVWSFTAEPYSYPITSITATASASQPGMGPEKTVGGVGLNANDQHSTDGMQMWMVGTMPSWIQYKFDKVCKLDKLLVWNSNQLIEGFIGFGVKAVKIEYSLDGQTWTGLSGVPEFAKAPGAATYTANTTVDFGGVDAMYVKLTITDNWGMVTQTGLSEVRFYAAPVQAREPAPAVAATGVSVNTEMDWRPGRGATSHKVHIGTDSNSVAASTTPAGTVTDHGYAPTNLEFGTKYFWKVDEVTAAGAYAGDVWNFTTQEYAVIDDFEGYNDDDNRIYDSWIDGVTTKASGSTVGYMQAPFAEKTVIHGGTQSMPMTYDNTASPYYSEAELAFDTPQNWTANRADSVSLYVQGVAPSFVQTASGNILMSGMGSDIWNNADQFRFAYKTLTGNGTIVARVHSVANSNAWAKAGVMIRQNADPGSVHAFMPLTPSGGNGASFQRRLLSAGVSTNTDAAATAPVTKPYWVKVERVADKFSGYVSPDGVTWTQLGITETIPMTGPVLIGLAVCSHVATALTGAEFSDVKTTGAVTGDWTVAGIGLEQLEGNSLEGLYLTVKDSAGKTKTLVNPDTALTGRMGWQQWKIPLSDLTAAGLKATAIKSITIGVGNKTSPVKGGAGKIYIDDIGYGRPLP